MFAFALFFLGLGVSTFANPGDEIILKTLSPDEVETYQEHLTSFAAVTTMQVVSVDEEQFLKISGTALNGEELVEMLVANNCGDCEYQDFHGNWVPGVFYLVNPQTKICITCEEDSNPGS